MNSIRYSLVLVLCSFLGYCQTQLKKLTQEDYKLWSNLSQENISPDGNWFTYKLGYDTTDTIFVRSTKSRINYYFPGAREGIFSENSKYIVITDNLKGSALLNLRSANLHWIPNALRLEFFLNGKFLAVLVKNGTGKNLKIIESESKIEYTVPDIRDFNISKDGKIAVLVKDRIEIIWPMQKFKTKTVVANSTGIFQKLLWSADGSTLAFIEQQPIDKTNNKIYHYNTASNNCIILNPLTAPKLAPYLILNSFSPMVLSDDGSKIFFYYASKPQQSETEIAEVWNAQSPLEYPRQKFQGLPELIPKLASWNPTNDSISFIGTNEHPKVILTSDRKFAVSYATLPYEPQAEYRSPADYYITNLITGESRLILKNQTTNDGYSGNSPKGSYFHYFKDDNWWVYDIGKNAHINLTKGLDAKFIDVENDYAGPAYGYISPGWTSDEKALIVYDQYDIWLLSPDGKSKNRITNGWERKIRFRIADNTSHEVIRAQGTADIVIRNFDLTKGLILETVGNDLKSGYFRWNAKNKLQPLIYKDSKINRFRKGNKTNNAIIVEQKSSVPPCIRLINVVSGKSRVLLQTNQHYNKFESGAVETINYKTTNDQNLKGILYYPSGFQMGKIYPMIVYVYSRQSKYLHEYYNPTMNSTVGFSPSNYTADGYLVLYPDIVYTLGEPGKSALNCVKAAISVVQEKDIVDNSHIGIIGHSFGGFEVSYIITQTNLFAAAVSGAAVTDFISSYLSMDLYSGYSNAWRYETQQYRIGKSLFENQEQYLKNSPILLASGIETPLLNWSGKEDSSVDWHQNLELHLAMRKLKKRNLFLVYPGQGHTLSNPEAQKDLTIRTKKWFDCYLKNIKCDAETLK